MNFRSLKQTQIKAHQLVLRQQILTRAKTIVLNNNFRSIILSKIHTCSTFQQLLFISVYEKILNPTKCRNYLLTEEITFVFILVLWMIFLPLCLIFK